MKPLQLPQKDLPLRLKTAYPFPPGKGFVHPETHHHHLSRPPIDKILQVLGVPLGPPTVAHLIARPGEAPQPQLKFGVRQLHTRLHASLLEEALHKRVSVKQESRPLL